jgi:PE-PPE domain
MPRAVRSLIASIVALLGVLMAAVLAASVAVAASALIVQGTGTPNSNIVAGLRQNARDYFLGNTPCDSATNCPDSNLTGINYPASFFPLAFIPRWCVPGRCNTWDDSVGQGVDNLSSALTPLLDNGQDVAILGYSQGAAVVSNELRSLRNLTPQQKSHLSVTLIGNIDNPDGGLFTRLGFLGHVPLIDVTTGLPTPTDTGIKLTTIDFEYDGVGDFPRYGGNLLADANAIAGFAYIHGTYLDPNQNGDFTGLPDGYTPTELKDQQNCRMHPTNCRTDDNGNSYILIPTKTLPIVQPFLDIASATGTTALVKPIVDLISPTLRVLINLGYDRTGNPGTYMTLSPLPFNPATFNPVQFATDLVDAAAAGIQALAGDLSAPPATVPDETPADRARRSAALVSVSARMATRQDPSKGTTAIEPAAKDDAAADKGEAATADDDSTADHRTRTPRHLRGGTTAIEPAAKDDAATDKGDASAKNDSKANRPRHTHVSAVRGHPERAKAAAGAKTVKARDDAHVSKSASRPGDSTPAKTADAARGPESHRSTAKDAIRHHDHASSGDSSGKHRRTAGHQ